MKSRVKEKNNSKRQLFLSYSTFNYKQMVWPVFLFFIHPLFCCFNGESLTSSEVINVLQDSLMKQWGLCGCSSNSSASVIGTTLSNPVNNFLNREIAWWRNTQTSHCYRYGSFLNSAFGNKMYIFEHAVYISYSVLNMDVKGRLYSIKY